MTVHFLDRCIITFERRTKGRRYVNRRWPCPRKAVKGSKYCGYCMPAAEKEARRLAKAAKP